MLVHASFAVVLTKRQAAGLKATTALAPVLQCRESEPNSDRNWRRNQANFRDATLCSIPPGVVDIAPAWFAQGHPVS